MSQPSSTPARESDREIERTASRWIGRRDAGMSLHEQAELAAWRQADPRHEQALARHEATWRFFDRPASAGQADELVAALARSRAHRGRRRLAAAASLVFIGTLGLVWQRAALPDALSLRAEPRSNAAVVVLPEKKALPDGSIVELKPGVDFVVDFSGEQRRVQLKRGEALFQVRKDASRPFVVTAAGVSVRAVGTAFSVQFEGNQVGVVVTEGRVAVDPSAGKEAPPAADTEVRRVEASPAVQAVHLLAGQGTTVHPSTAGPPQVEVLSPADLAARLAWRSPRLEFSSTPLSEAVELFNRYAPESGSSRLAIEPGDETLARLEVSGYFRANNVPAFLHLISQTLGIAAEPRGDHTVLRRAR